MPRVPPGGSSSSPTDTRDRFLLAERQQESGGNYLIVNPGSGALGAWQVLPSNLPEWERESGLPQLSPYQYLHDARAQDHLVGVILGGQYDSHGAAAAAAWWYSGQYDPTATYGDPPVYQYVNDVLALMGSNLPAPNYGPPPGGPAFTLPPPNEGDWSQVITAAAAVHRAAAGKIALYNRAIVRIT